MPENSHFWQVKFLPGNSGKDSYMVASSLGDSLGYKALYKLNIVFTQNSYAEIIYVEYFAGRAAQGKSQVKSDG